MTQHNNKTFQVFEVALELMRGARVVREVVARRDRDLGDQLARALSSVGLRAAEGNRRVGRDRVQYFRIASGSADEVRAALRIAEALGYVEPADIAPLLELTDRIVAMLYRLIHPRR